jgi:hypothetical protein
MRAPAALAVTVAASLAGAGAAHAGSLTYLKDGDVWLAGPDGADQRRLTTQGGFSSPSQADDGTVVAVHRETTDRNTSGRLYRFDRTGAALGAPVAAGKPGSHSFIGPGGAAVSPTGALVAYHYFDASPDPAIAFAPVGRDSTYSEYGQITGYFNPSWYDAGHVVAFAPGLTPTALIYAPGPGDGSNGTSQGWFEDPDAKLSMGEADRPLDRFAATTSGGGQLRLYAMTGPPPAPPVSRCAFSAADGTFSHPTWSPDGRALAFEEPDGIHVAAVPTLDDCPRVTEALVIPGGHDPDWGPADLPANTGTPPASPASPAAPGAPAAPGGPGAPGADRTAPRLTLTVPRARLAAALRVGMRVRIRATEAGRARVTGSAGGRVVAAGAAALRRAGTATVTARFTAAARRRLRHAHRLRLTLRATVTDAAGNAGRATATLTLGSGR